MMKRWGRSGATASMFAVDAFRLGCVETSAEYRAAIREVLDALREEAQSGHMVGTGWWARDEPSIPPRYGMAAVRVFSALAALGALAGEGK